MWGSVDRLQPPGLYAPRRAAIYRLITSVGQQIAADAQASLHAFFPVLSQTATLAKHGAAFGVPRLPADTDGEYRDRVATAATYLEQAGLRGAVRAMLESLVPGRHQAVELPRDGFRLGYEQLGSVMMAAGPRYIVRVTEPSEREIAEIQAFLYETLDADCEVIVYARTEP